MLGRLQTCVMSLKSTNLPFSRCRIFVSLEITSALIAHYDNTPFWVRAGVAKPAPIRMTLNYLECPIHLKVRFTDGTLDVRTLWLSDSTIRIL